LRQRANSAFFDHFLTDFGIFFDRILRQQVLFGKGTNISAIEIGKRKGKTQKANLSTSQFQSRKMATKLAEFHQNGREFHQSDENFIKMTRVSSK
jgi:hypothetical protein